MGERTRQLEVPTLKKEVKSLKEKLREMERIEEQETDNGEYIAIICEREVTINELYIDNKQLKDTIDEQDKTISINEALIPKLIETMRETMRVTQGVDMTFWEC